MGENGNSQDSNGRGDGGSKFSERTESGLTAIKEQRMISRAMRGGWIDDERPWDLDVTPSDIERLQRSKGELSMKDRCVLSVLHALSSKDERVTGIARGHVLAMSSQNLAMAMKKLPDLVAHYHQMADDEKRARLSEIVAAARNGSHSS